MKNTMIGSYTLSCILLYTTALATFILAMPAYAEILRSDVAFNNSIGEKTANQPENGIEVAYQITLEGGELDGCTVDIVEALHPREEGTWGIFDIEGHVTCEDSDFSYSSSGAWDDNGFHASGDIKSGNGSFQNITGRVAQLGGSATDAGNDTLDVSYSLVFDLTR